MLASDNLRLRRLMQVLSLVVFAIIAIIGWNSIDHASFGRAIGLLEAWHVAVVVVVATLHIAGRVLRFHWLMRRAGATEEYRLLDGTRIFLIGLCTSAITPAKVGDLLKVPLMRVYGVAPQTGVGLVAVERALDLLVTALFISLFGFLLPVDSRSWQTAGFVLLCGLVLSIVVVSRRGLRDAVLSRVFAGLARLLGRGRLGRAERRLEALFSVWDQVFVSPARFSGYSLFSAGVWAVEFLKLWLRPWRAWEWVQPTWPR